MPVVKKPAWAGYADKVAESAIKTEEPKIEDPKIDVPSASVTTLNQPLMPGPSP